MRGPVLARVLLLALAQTVLECWPACAMSVLYPPDGAAVTGSVVHVVLRLGPAVVDRISAGLDGQEPGAVLTPTKREILCLAVNLAKGANTVVLLGSKQGRVVERLGVRIFLISDLDPACREVPAGYQRYVFHAGSSEQDCAGCHDMEPTLSSLRPTRPEEAACYPCHADKGKGVFTHKPAMQWTCFACHEVQPGERKYTTLQPDEKTCYPCHAKAISLWRSKRLMHGPTAVGHCTLCHNPHGSERPDLMRMQTTDLCINCHEEKATGAHVIAAFFGKGHPVRGVPDPFRPDREFTCAGCHNPHAGDTQNLLHHDNSDLTQYCRNCHKL